MSRKPVADTAPVRAWLTEPLSGPVKESIGRLRTLPDVHRLAVMPDVHLGEGVCVGVVLATGSLVYPAAVGGDIGCGITTLAMAGDTAALGDAGVLRRFLDGLPSVAPIMRHRSLAEAPELGVGCDPNDLLAPGLAGEARRMGRIELGTLGRGNHFLELQIDSDGVAWLMVHSGSRAMGQAVTRSYAGVARRGKRGMSFLDAQTEVGRGYLADSAWACRYAAASRAVVLGGAARWLGSLTGLAPDASTIVDCSHNHVREEAHGGRLLLVHRKGASPADEGLPGLIPGAMGRESFHVTGRGHPDSLRSSSHGAGRALSRTEARRLLSTWAMVEDVGGVVYDERLAGRLLEEAPGAYKDIRAVMRAQRDLVRIERVVRGLVCYKGGD